MSSSTLLRIASKSPSVCLIRSSQAPVRRLTPSYTLSSSPYIAKGPSQCFSTTSRSRSSAHGEETFDEFNARYAPFAFTHLLLAGGRGTRSIIWQWVNCLRRYENEFNKVEDVFELQVRQTSILGPAGELTREQRNLNNSFSYDLVPTVAVCTAALRAARRVHDYPTAVRVFEGRSTASRLRCIRVSHACIRYQGQSREQGAIRGVS